MQGVVNDLARVISTELHSASQVIDTVRHVCPYHLVDVVTFVHELEQVYRVSSINVRATKSDHAIENKLVRDETSTVAVRLSQCKPGEVRAQTGVGD